MFVVGSFLTLMLHAASPFQPLASAIEMDGEPGEIANFNEVAMIGDSVFAPAPGLEPEGRSLTVWAVDERYLWVGVRVVFATPRPLLGPVGRRDEIPTGDEVILIIDPAGKGERAFRFATNPSGVIQDAMILAPENESYAWDSLADVATRSFDDGWFAEFKIPLQELSIPSLAGTWGINVLTRLWKEEQRTSLFPIDVGQRNKVARVGYVELSLESVPELSLRMLPSLTTAWSDETPAADCQSAFERGRFVTCETASSVGLSGSVMLGNHTDIQFAMNPDFSQVEADVPQVGLNERFALFYPEKRPFFTRVGALVPGRIDIFYTRSIGLPLVGFQARHRRGSSSILGLSAYDIEPQGSITDERVDAFNATETLTNLARFEETLDDGRLGATYIDRLWLADGEMRGYNGVVGFDGSYRPNREWSMQWELLGSSLSLEDEGREFGGADRFFVQYNDGDYRWFAKHEYIAEEFRAEAGFIPRLGYHQIMTKFDLYFRDVGGMNFGSPGVYISSYLDESGKAIEHFAGSNFYIRWAGHLWTFTKYEIRPELIETSDEWLLPQRLDLAIGSQVTPWLNLRTSAEFGTSIIRDEDILDGRAPFLGRSIDYEAGFEARPLPSILLAGGGRGRALFDEKNELLGEDLVIVGLGEWYMNRDDSLRVIYQRSLGDDTWSADLLGTHRPVNGFIGFLGYRLESSGGELVQRVFMKASYQFGT